MRNTKKACYKHESKYTNLGAIRDDKVIVLSGGGLSPLEFPIITKQSPEGTAFTFPLNHPVAPATVDDDEDAI